MNSKRNLFIVLSLAALFFSNCAPNNEMYIENAAGFWAGLWHGLIIIITFIISLFSENVTIYEINNSGALYNLGFVLGILISIGNGHARCTAKKKSDKEKEWEDIGEKVEEKVRTGIKNWVEETDRTDEDWEEIGRKVEEKIKRELKNWAEK